jgi:hypothetical protein
MTKRIALVQCGKSKMDLDDGTAAPAKELYNGSYFRSKRYLGENTDIFDEWYVVSGAHGIIRPSEEIKWYDTNLSDLAVWERSELYQVIEEDIENLGLTCGDQEIVALMSSKYLDECPDMKGRTLRDILNSLPGKQLYPFDGSPGLYDQQPWITVCRDDDQLIVPDWKIGRGNSPKLPVGFKLPLCINGWSYVPDSGLNAHVWKSTDETSAVGVFYTLGTVRVKAIDERLSGFENSQIIATAVVDEDDQYTEREKSAIAEGVTTSIEWMRDTDPSSWSLPEGNEAIFHAPRGYSYHVCYLESQKTTIYYERDDVDGIPDRGSPSLPEEHRYLVIEVYRGSGNASVRVAPWEGAHEHNQHEVMDCPDGCGLDIALKLARQYAAPDSVDTLVGQPGLNEWSAA